ncbi:MAG: T9SS type A sorting domain-containing protein [Bacteroidota bacterium]
MAVFACAAALMLGACDSSTTEPAPIDERFGIAVVAETPGGEPVEGLRVAMRPCFPVLVEGRLQDECATAVPAAPSQPAARAAASGIADVPSDFVRGDFVRGEAVEALQVRSGVSTQLGNAYPVPFSETTTYEYRVGTDGEAVTIEVADLAGGVVTVVDGNTNLGDHREQWRPDTLPSGVYVLRLRSGDTVVDSLAVARWAVLPDDAIDGPDVRGATNAMGTFETRDVMLAPAFYGPDELEYRGLNNELLGTFALPERVRVTLIDPATGAQQAYDRAIVDGPNTFTLTWDQ